MFTEIEKIQFDYLETLNKQKFIPEDLDYSIMDKHIEFLEKLNVIENSSISIFDLYQRKHVYLSSRFETVFGFNIDEAHEEGNEYFDKKVHPDDNLNAMKIGSYFLKIAYTLPIEKRKDYKLINDYRIKNGEDKYIRVIEQFQALELDKHGNIWLALCVMDFSPNQDISLPLQNKVINFRTGELFHFPETTKEINLSKREKEILGLISEGLISKEIADNLFISVHTVNTHRQKIIEKLNVKNSHEAIKLAK
ncbi:MAG: helix-turn-helix transcriptional regulator, partial [Bacteroidales bacterium]|nr:helix-turn-helix transcriptional regulator [Bacteroidales bacterium]